VTTAAFSIREVEEKDRDWIDQFTRDRWSASMVVVHGTVYSPRGLPGFIAESAGERVGLATYTIEDGECEVVTLDSVRQGAGIGTALLDSVRRRAAQLGCLRLRVVTTNDNLEALKFYQRRGFHLSRLHPGAVDESRKLKPQIALTGEHGIAIRDELELEMSLGGTGGQHAGAVPGNVEAGRRSRSPGRKARLRREDREEIERLFERHGYTDFRWIAPESIVLAHWVRMKCVFGCETYGTNASCPPNVPDVDECRRFVGEYGEAVVFHFEKRVERPADRHEWTKGVNANLLKLEREVFLLGHEKAFLLFMDSCNLCSECVRVRAECRQPRNARPTPEALGVDVFSTVRQYDYPIEVLEDYSRPMNRYAFLLIE
jgi:predicted metal-binding protein/GNAT superfamily N-acetyltransferase